MVNVTRYSITHASVVVTLLAILLVGGVYSFWQLGKREDSTFTIKSAVVVAPYAGATPEVQLIQPIFPVRSAKVRGLRRIRCPSRSVCRPEKPAAYTRPW